MELKWRGEGAPIARPEGFNRTFMELKFNQQIAGWQEKAV